MYIKVEVIMTQETYSVFKDYEKKLIVLGATIASLFSPLSSSIYLPTLNTLAQDLHVSNSLINLTVTTYLVGLPILKNSTSMSRNASDTYQASRYSKVSRLRSSEASRMARAGDPPT